MAKILVPFIGGDWHGEAKQFKTDVKGSLDSSITVGKPPRYIGGNQYDANRIEHEIYILRGYQDRFYYVHQSLIDLETPMEELIALRYETPNAKRMREEQERSKRNSYRQQFDAAHSQFIRACIAKHEFLDENGIHNPRIDELIAMEDKTWTARKRTLAIMDAYKGEKPVLKSVAKN